MNEPLSEAWSQFTQHAISDVPGVQEERTITPPVDLPSSNGNTSAVDQDSSQNNEKEKSLEPPPDEDSAQDEETENDTPRSDSDGRYSFKRDSIPSDHTQGKPEPSSQEKPPQEQKTLIEKVFTPIIESSPVKFARKVSSKVFTPIGKLITWLYNRWK